MLVVITDAFGRFSFDFCGKCIVVNPVDEAWSRVCRTSATHLLSFPFVLTSKKIVWNCTFEESVISEDSATWPRCTSCSRFDDVRMLWAGSVVTRKQSFRSMRSG